MDMIIFLDKISYIFNKKCINDEFFDVDKLCKEVDYHIDNEIDSELLIKLVNNPHDVFDTNEKLREYYRFYLYSLNYDMNFNMCNLFDKEFTERDIKMLYRAMKSDFIIFQNYIKLRIYKYRNKIYTFDINEKLPFNLEVCLLINEIPKNVFMTRKFNTKLSDAENIILHKLLFLKKEILKGAKKYIAIKSDIKSDIESDIKNDNVK